MRFALATLLLLGSCGQSPEPSERPPNFVIIMADDLGYGDLSSYGGWIDVPSLDRMAAEGLRFTDFHSNGAVCSPTRAALLTGRYQQRAGIPAVVVAAPNGPTHSDGLQDVEITFAEMLRERGYASGIIGKWHLGYNPQYNPTRHGFDIFRGYLSGNIDFFSHVDQAGSFDWWYGTKSSDEPGYVTTLINEHALRFIEDHQDKPFCLYVAHEAPHYPYQGPQDDPNGFRVVGQTSVRQDLLAEEIRQKYREMVVEMDRGVGGVLASLTRLRLADRTLVLFFSDNGATPNGSNGPLRGFKGSVWEGGHRVPALAWRPGTVEAGAETHQLGATFDIWPTLAELAGVPLPADRLLDGASLVSVLEGRSLKRSPMFWSYRDGLAMRDGDWKLVVGEGGQEQPMLFNLAEDLGEQNDLSAQQPDRTAAMFQAAEQWLREVDADATPQPSAQH